MKARRLLRASIPGHVLGRPSPATPHSRRIALLPPDPGRQSCDIYVASGSRIYYLEVELPTERHNAQQGKDNLLIPSHTQILDAKELRRCPHQAEVQCIAFNSPSQLLGSVDSYGRLIVSKLDTPGTAGASCSYSVLPPDLGAGEAGWAGCVFFPQQPSLVAVARGFAKSIDLYDQDVHVRTLHTLLPPTALTVLEGVGSSTVAICEGQQLSIWDLRAGEHGGCVQRLAASFTNEPLYTVCSSRYGLVGTGGADRSVTVFDHLRWSPRARWVNSLKYEVTGMAFSSAQRNFVFAYGLDFEVAGGGWSDCETENTIKRNLAFRGDSRWLGVDKCSDADILVGWSESGTIFLADFEATG